MKKMTIVTVIMILVLSLAGCGAGSSSGWKRVKTTTYGADGTVNQYTEYSYDNSGRLESYTGINAKSGAKTVFSQNGYSGKQNVILVSEDGNTEVEVDMTSMNMVKSTMHSKDGDAIYLYDEEGTLIKQTFVSPGGETISEVKLFVEYQRDDEGRITESTIYEDPDKFTVRQIVRYEYDTDGNMVKMSTYDDWSHLKYYAVCEYEQVR